MQARKKNGALVVNVQ